jgi:hypothetical protein
MERWTFHFRANDRSGVLAAVASLFADRGVSLDWIMTAAGKGAGDPYGAAALAFRATEAKQAYLARLLSRLEAVRDISVHRYDTEEAYLSAFSKGVSPAPPLPYRLKILPKTLAICRLDARAPLPQWTDETALLSLTQTPEEISLVCEEDAVPLKTLCDRGWRGLRVEGNLPLTMTGVLASLLNPLAEAGVNIFALSTYDTDIILVPDAKLSLAKSALEQCGCTFTEEDSNES